MSESKAKMPKYKHFYKNKQTSLSIINLKKQNAYLEKTLNELSHHHSELFKLVERLLSLEAVRLESSQQLKDKNTTMALLSDQLSNKRRKLADVLTKERLSSFFREVEEMKDKLVCISSRCQQLTNKVEEAKESNADVQGSETNIIELQKKLDDALEKNKQWLDYDQQREAYVRAILARMLWLEKQLKEANWACSQQHNANHSDEKRKIKQVTEYFEGLLQRANDELDLMKEQVSVTQQALTEAQKECKEKQNKVEEVEQQLQIELNSRKPDQFSDNEEQWLKGEAKDLQGRLNKEKRRSAALELQTSLLQRFMVNHHEKTQENIGVLERTIEISSQDLQDEKQNSSYLKKQLFRALKKLQYKGKYRTTRSSDQVDHQDHSSCVAALAPTQPWRNILPPSPHSNLLDDSVLECPGCRSVYPASQYKDLLDHIDWCLD
ncbi:centrosomal protein of 55 kDa-like [Sphaeramia orbicularis]|uniref:centrosomal protein of 55 kDa-like n=1 Tax=Sphaeramia orbicularis TaxID=375764 RepID=UPI00117FAA7A|nr:centrosomal protein of 55 kDa-like [Sphaeramia orbicularis]